MREHLSSQATSSSALLVIATSARPPHVHIHEPEPIYMSWFLETLYFCATPETHLVTTGNLVDLLQQTATAPPQRLLSTTTVLTSYVVLCLAVSDQFCAQCTVRCTNSTPTPSHAAIPCRTCLHRTWYFPRATPLPTFMMCICICMRTMPFPHPASHLDTGYRFWAGGLAPYTARGLVPVEEHQLVAWVPPGAISSPELTFRKNG